MALKRLRDEGRALIDEAAIFRTIEQMRKIAEEAVTATKTARRQRERLRVIEGGRGAPAIQPVVQSTPISDASRDDEEKEKLLPWQRMLPVEEWT